MQRRDFLRLSATSAVVVAVAPSLITQKLYAENGNLYQTFEKVQLKDAEGNALKASTLVVEENYVFNYPHVGTPAIMVNLTSAAQKDIKLKAEDGTEYIYTGGAGDKGTIVAYSAICPHQLTHPQPEMSMFQYVSEKGKTLAYDKGGVFVCSSHLSAFEPKQGGNVVGGPANEGLASIILEIDKEDNIWAVAVLGPEKFQDYFDAFKDEFKKFYGNRRKAKKLVKEKAIVKTLKNYSIALIQS
ncbi:MAG: sulfur oxidation protein [Sulfurovum sp.]|nr:MAG: sulfur oxidation protein [Sulfurovum sp.]